MCSGSQSQSFSVLGQVYCDFVVYQDTVGRQKWFDKSLKTDENPTAKNLVRSAAARSGFSKKGAVPYKQFKRRF